MYLWNILHMNENELVRKVYEIKKVKFIKEDWFQMIQKEKTKYSIDLSDEEIAKTSKNKLKIWWTKKLIYMHSII